jgi:hypothetical protein
VDADLEGVALEDDRVRHPALLSQARLLPVAIP